MTSPTAAQNEMFVVLSERPLPMAMHRYLMLSGSLSLHRGWRKQIPTSL